MVGDAKSNRQKRKEEETEEGKRPGVAGRQGEGGKE